MVSHNARASGFKSKAAARHDAAKKVHFKDQIPAEMEFANYYAQMAAVELLEQIVGLLEGRGTDASSGSAGRHSS